MGHQSAPGGIFHGLGRLIEPAPSVSVLLSRAEGGDYKKALMFWASLLGLIVSPITAASTAVVAWIGVHRGRADAPLKELQVEKMRLGMEKLRVELERARLEAERQRPLVVAAA